MAEKVIGILGGMGPEATLDCFEKIVRNTPAARTKENWHKSRNYNKADDPFSLRGLLRCEECDYSLFPKWVKE